MLRRSRRPSSGVPGVSSAILSAPRLRCEEREPREAASVDPGIDKQ
jgi:hypothetical protein